MCLLLKTCPLLCFKLISLKKVGDQLNSLIQLLITTGVKERERLGPRVLWWQRHNRCHFIGNNTQTAATNMTIKRKKILLTWRLFFCDLHFSPTFEEQRYNISRDSVLTSSLSSFGQSIDVNNLVPRVSLLCLPWSLEERPWLRLVTLPPRIWVAKKPVGGGEEGSQSILFGRCEKLCAFEILQQSLKTTRSIGVRSQICGWRMLHMISATFTI